MGALRDAEAELFQRTSPLLREMPEDVFDRDLDASYAAGEKRLASG